MEDLQRTLNNFVQNKNAVKVVSTLVLFGLSIHFFFVGLLEIDIVFDVLSLDSYSFYRLWNITLGIALMFVAYASYMQNKSLVDDSLIKAKDRVAKESKSLASKVDDEKEVKPANSKAVTKK